MLGAYTTYVVQLAMPDHIALSIPVAIPAAFVVAGLAGVLLERTVIRFLYGRPLETLLATFGVSLMLQQLVRSVFSANNRAVETPAWMSGTLQVNEALAITSTVSTSSSSRWPSSAFCSLVLKRTRLGLEIRAVSQNRGDGAGDGHPERVGRCGDVRPRVRHRRRGRRGAQPAHQRRPEPRPGLHHRFVHGGGLRRRRQPLGHAHRRHVAGHRQQAARTLCRRRARQDSGARRADPVHSAAAARPVSADRAARRRATS